MVALKLSPRKKKHGKRRKILTSKCIVLNVLEYLRPYMLTLGKLMIIIAFNKRKI